MGIRALALAVGAASVVPVLGVLPASAATGEQYLLQATDPHGNVWLPGTVDGTTTGKMDPGTDPTSAGYGHLWTTDVPSGFCRIVPPDSTNAANHLDRSTPGGCIAAGGKPGQPQLDPTRNADGTFFVYTPDWAVNSGGVYRLTYDPGSQTMTKAELLAPNRYPANNKPFDVALGPKDHKLYVSNDKDGNIARISGVNGAISQQTVETSVAHTTDGARSRAITFACWSPLNGSRTAGAASCTPGDGTAPDLVIAQKNLVTVVLNAETCQTTGSCVTRQTPVQVLTPMGLRTDPANPDVVYVSDSPGTTSQIIRYTISTNTQDSYANYGILDDGSSSPLSFAFSVGFGPDHSMYIGDDPTAGATSFNGRYFRVAPYAPADALGSPGKAASPPPPPTPQNGSLVASNVTQPTDGVYMGGHLWVPDAVNGLCRMDPDPTGQLVETPSTCVVGANAAGMTKPEQSAFDATNNLLYVSDASSASVGVVRFHFDPNGDLGNGTLTTPEVLASGLVGTGNGLDGQRADAVALDPTSGNLYVGFRARNLGAATQIARVNNPSAPDTTTQTVDFVAKTTRSVPVFGLGVIVNPAANGVPQTSDLYIADNKGVDELTNVNTCQPGGCFPLLALNVRGPKGFATDGKDQLFMASPPAPGSASANTVVQRYTISKGELFDYSATGTKPDGTSQPYGFVFGLTLDPKTNDLYVEDDANAVAPPNGTGHVWKVAPGAGTTTPPTTPPPSSTPPPAPAPAPAPTGTATATAPVATLPIGVPASTASVPVKVSWTGNGQAYELQESTNGSAFFDVPGFTASQPGSATSTTVGLTSSPTNKAGGTTYAFRVVAQDSTGALGAPSPAGPTFSVPATDNTGGFSFNGAWSGVNLAGAYGGSVQQSSTVNATAQNANPLTGTSLALVSTTGPDRGIAQLTLDGTVVGTVDLYSPTQQTGVVVWSRDGLNGVGHTLKVTVTSQKNAASTGNKVDVDAYTALK